jgi:hypothetical protein
LRNFSRDDVAIVNVSGKPLPFRNNLKTYKSDNYQQIMKAIAAAPQKSIVIDDATYLMVNEFMRTAKQTGYQKYTDMAVSFNQLIEFAATLPDDKIVYFIGHSDQADDGREHFKTIGKMLDNYVTVEGRFTIVMKTVVQDGRYLFSTQNNGQDTVKTPLGLFDKLLIENDLKYVHDKFREYWNMEEENA